MSNTNKPNMSQVKNAKIKIGIENLTIKNGKCAVEIALKILCGKWNTLLMNSCAKEDLSLSQLRILFPNIPRTTINKKLKQLENQGLLKLIDEKYSATEMTIELLQIAHQINDFLNINVSPNLSLEERYTHINKMIGQKWKSRILWLLLNYKTVRFNEFCHTLEGISHKVLKELLDDMESMDIVERKVYDEKVPKVEYSLSPKGEQLAVFIDYLSQWARHYGLLSQKVTITLE